MAVWFMTKEVDVIEVGDTGSCAHTRMHRGKDAPLRWGSARTEVCRDCAAFRLRTHHDEIRGDWMAGDQYADAVSEQELD